MKKLGERHHERILNAVIELNDALTDAFHDGVHSDLLRSMRGLGSVIERKLINGWVNDD